MPWDALVDSPAFWMEILLEPEHHETGTDMVGHGLSRPAFEPAWPLCRYIDDDGVCSTQA